MDRNITPFKKQVWLRVQQERNAVCWEFPAGSSPETTVVVEMNGKMYQCGPINLADGRPTVKMVELLKEAFDSEFGHEEWNCYGGEPQPCPPKTNGRQFL